MAMIRKRKSKGFKSEKPTPTRLDFIFLMSFGVLLAWSLVAGIVSTTVFSQDYAFLFFQVTFATAVIGALFSHKHLARIGLVLLSGFFIFFVFGFFPAYDEVVGGNFNRNLIGAVTFLSGNGPLVPAYESVILWTISGAFSLFVVLFCYRRFRFFVLFSVSSLTFGLLSSARVFRFPFSFHLFAFVMLTFLLRYLYQQNLKRFAETSPPSLSYLLPVPVVIATLFVTNLFPTPETGFLESTVQSAMVQPFNFVNDLFRGTSMEGEFSLQQVGFSDTTSQLGGDVSLNNGLFMRIRTDLPMPLYLTGLTRDTYTGYSWMNRYDDFTPVDFHVAEQNLELFERATAWYLYLMQHADGIANHRYVLADANSLDDPWWQENFYHNPNLRIFIDPSTYTPDIWIPSQESQIQNIRFMFDRQNLEVHVLNARPTSVFHTGIVQAISSDEATSSFLRHREGQLVTEERMARNSSYTLQIGVPLNWDTPQLSHQYVFSDMLQLIETFREVYGYNLITEQFSHHNMTLTYEELLTNYLIPRADNIRAIYTQLPDDFPVEVANLAYEITSGAMNDYQRMQMLEQYLRSNFIYTLTPGPSPADQDFIYHFLFDIQEGYCVHFATAFVTMARSLGMPARYVEGFRLHTRAGEDGYIDVLNNMAHAWAEVYFEGYGWYTFEPTPASSQSINRDPSQNRPDNTPNQQPNEEATTPVVTTPANDAEQPNDDNQTPAVSDEDPNQEPSEERGHDPLIWTLIGLLTLGSSSFLIRWTHRRRKGSIKKKNKTTTLNQFATLFSQLEFLKLEPATHETISQFMDRLGNQRSTTATGKQHFKQLANLFNKARYGEQPLTDEEQDLVEKIIDVLDAQIKSNTSKWKYALYRWRMRSK